MKSRVGHVKIIDNSFVQNALAYLRDKNTGIEVFRKYAAEISYPLIEASLSGLPRNERKVKTPTGEAEAFKLSEELVVIAILRSALALLPAALKLLPSAKVGF